MMIRLRLLVLFVLVLVALAACQQRLEAPRVASGPAPLIDDASIDAASSAHVKGSQSVVGQEAGELSDWVAVDATGDAAVDGEIASSAVLAGAVGTVAFVRHNPSLESNPWTVFLVDQVSDVTTLVYGGRREVDSVAVSADGDVLLLAMRRTIDASSDFEVYRVVLSSGVTERLTVTAADERNVSLSADGSVMVWEGEDAGGRRAVFVREGDVESRLRLTLEQREPSVSGDGRFIVLVRELSGGNLRVVRYDRLENAYLVLWGQELPVVLSHPSVSDGGGRVALLEYRPPGTAPTERQLVRYLDLGAGSVVNAVGAQLTDGLRIAHPHLAGDGDHLVYGWRQGEVWNVFTRRVSTLETQRIVASVAPVNNHAPYWVVPVSAPAVSRVLIDQSDVSLLADESAALSVTVDALGGASKDVTWSSTDEGVATVTAQGVVMGIAPGKATIVATSVFDPSKSDSVEVTVTEVGVQVGLFDDFADFDFTANPAWTFVEISAHVAGAVSAADGYARFVRTGAGGGYGYAGLEIEVDILVSADTVVRFDALAAYRSVRSGCGDSCGEHPANVRLTLEDVTGTQYQVRYAFNYDGAVEDKLTETYKQIAISLPQGEWSRDLEYAVSDAWPEAVRVVKVEVFGNGWDFEGGIDNIFVGEGVPNRAPQIVITQPGNGAEFAETDIVTFAATASDPEDGDLGASVSWTSDLDGVLGTGAAITSPLSSGTHTITATVTDSGALTASDAVTVTMMPVSGITSLSDDFDDGDFTSNPAWGAVNDDDIPGTLDSSDGYVRWIRSNALGNGGAVGIDIAVDIPVTDATIVALDVLATFRDVGDGCGWTCGEYPANVMLYLENAHGDLYRLRYAFNYGTALADNDRDDYRQIATAVPQGEWARGLAFGIRDGWPEATRVYRVHLFGNGWNFDGGVDNIFVGEGTLNSAPTVVIASPAEGAEFDEDEAITFAGTATDPEEGDLGANLTWTSSIDGVLGTGTSFERALSVGEHLVTASVSDAGGRSGSDAVSIVITSAPPPVTGTLAVNVTPDTASVVIRDATNDIVHGGTGDQSIVVSAGEYTISASESGFQPASATATVISGETTHVSLTLTPAVVETGTLSITVDPSDAVVRVRNADGATVHQDAGDVVLTLPVGGYTVRVSASGFVTQNHTVAVLADQTTGESYVLQPVGSDVGAIRVRVLDHDGTPQPLATVRLREGGDPTDLIGTGLATYLTDASGYVVFDALPAGMYFYAVYLKSDDHPDLVITENWGREGYVEVTAGVTNERVFTRNLPRLSGVVTYPSSVDVLTAFTVEAGAVNPEGLDLRLRLAVDRVECAPAPGCSDTREPVFGPIAYAGDSVSVTIAPTAPGTYVAYYRLEAFTENKNWSGGYWWEIVDQVPFDAMSFVGRGVAPEISARAPAPTYIDLDWNTFEGATGYEIAYSGRGLSGTIAVADALVGTYRHEGVAAGAEYCFTIRALYGPWATEASAPACARTDAYEGFAISFASFPHAGPLEDVRTIAWSSTGGGAGVEYRYRLNVPIAWWNVVARVQSWVVNQWSDWSATDTVSYAGFVAEGTYAFIVQARRSSAPEFVKSATLLFEIGDGLPRLSFTSVPLSDLPIEADMDYAWEAEAGSECQQRFDGPGYVWYGAFYNMNAWSPWTDCSVNDEFRAFDIVADGTWALRANARNPSTGKVSRIRYASSLHYTPPELYQEAATIDWAYIEAGVTEGERYRRAAEEYRDCRDMYMDLWAHERAFQLTIEPQTSPLFQVLEHVTSLDFDLGDSFGANTGEGIVEVVVDAALEQGMEPVFEKISGVLATRAIAVTRTGATQFGNALANRVPITAHTLGIGSYVAEHGHYVVDAVGDASKVYSIAVWGTWAGRLLVSNVKLNKYAVSATVCALAANAYEDMERSQASPPVFSDVQGPVDGEVGVPLEWSFLVSDADTPVSLWRVFLSVFVAPDTSSPIHQVEIQAPPGDDDGTDGVRYEYSWMPPATTTTTYSWELYVEDGEFGRRYPETGYAEVTVTPALPTCDFRVSRTSITRTASAGSTPSQSGFYLDNYGSGNCAFSIPSIPSFVDSVEPRSGSIAAGGREWILIRWETCPASSSSDRTATLSITGDDDASVSLRRVCELSAIWRTNPINLRWDVPLGEQGSPKTFRLYNDGINSSYTTQVRGTTMLSVSPTSGSVQGGGSDYDTITVTPAVCTESRGYDGEIRVAGGSDIHDVDILLFCLGAFWQLEIDHPIDTGDVINFGSYAGDGTPAYRDVILRNHGDDSPFTITVDQDYYDVGDHGTWLSVTPTSGTVRNYGDGGFYDIERLTVRSNGCVPGRNRMTGSFTVSGSGDEIEMIVVQYCN